ncbi:molybdate ABC transporter substrate-binding protein [Henriciella barbarensis]|uniref:Molybdate ABC transporter substrate-binding protein n=1 Tax=Henriciella barbarensis TaxID=86342 RepID=A0A399R110_9PROT|nr:molybdate ABC transporter substrate-binding protein [Henriciella barbarensis]RIJ23452.1 molybdate ABC transporter substrate-binding protein [Henriciella barbarensis]
MSRLLWIRRAGIAVTLPLALIAGCGQAHQGDVMVAVATNFLDTAKVLEAEFEAETGFEVTLSSGSTGQLYSQIENGAPFDVFLAADRDRPRRLIEAGRGMEGTQFTYAAGRLVLWMPASQTPQFDGEKELRDGAYRAVALANPALAPYGAAAEETLASLELADLVSDRVVYGQNIGQAYALVASGNAELGFVAASQLASRVAPDRGGVWAVPDDLHAPIRQDLVLMQRAAGNDAALKFITFLRSDKALSIMREYGYEAG